jgi:N6-adenosine-specific RNA methylase IME4
VIERPRGEPTAKPEAVLELIEAYFFNLPKIELNRRGPARPGWSQ